MRYHTRIFVAFLVGLFFVASHAFAAQTLGSVSDPSFSGLFFDIGIGPQRIAQTLSASGTTTPYVDTYSVQGDTTGQAMTLSSLLKVGYSLEWQKKFHLDVTAFYNAMSGRSFEQNLYYNNGLGYLSSKTDVQSSYGLLIQPGYHFDSAGLAYLNLGVGFVPMSVTAAYYDTGTGESIYNTEQCTHLTALSPIVGLGYQRHIDFLKSLHVANLNWYVEYNYWFTVSDSVSNSTIIPFAGSVYQYSAQAKTSNNQLLVGVRYYFA